VNFGCHAATDNFWLSYIVMVVTPILHHPTMSSNDDEYKDESPLAKKRRVQRACDVCRRKKSNASLSYNSLDIP